MEPVPATHNPVSGKPLDSRISDLTVSRQDRLAEERNVFSWDPSSPWAVSVRAIRCCRAHVAPLTPQQLAEMESAAAIDVEDEKEDEAENPTQPIIFKPPPWETYRRARLRRL